MELVFVALPVALLIAGGVLWAFVWAAKGDQFEDLETPPRRAIFDDLPARERSAGAGKTAVQAPRSQVPRVDSGEGA
jgi:cbb3-type cytochrome oxidase maturation protein